MMEEEFTLDIDRILKEKAGKKAKYIPRFLVNWLIKIAHQDELNDYLHGIGYKQYGVDFLDSAMEYLRIETKAKTKIDGVVYDGLDKIPSNEDGRYYTIVCNHPLGGLDGISLGSVVCHKFDNKMVYLVNDLLMNFRGLAPLCVPINKTGKQGRDFPKMVEAAFQSEKNVVMFPAGLCSRKQDDGSIRDVDWKKTFITKSVEYKRDIIPVYFSGRNSDKFYNIARWCKKLNLKFNIAMLFLSDEMFKNVGSRFSVTFGEPIPWQTFDKSKSANEWAQWVKNKVYELQ